LTDITTQAQGFHFSKAVGAERASEMLRHGRVVLAGESLSGPRAAPGNCSAQTSAQLNASRDKTCGVAKSRADR
jgi:hypothetical protein